METITSSPSLNLPGTEIHLHDGWVANWNHLLGTYMFHNSRIGVTQQQWPASDADTLFNPPTRIMSMDNIQARKQQMLKILSSIQLNLAFARDPGSNSIVQNLGILGYRLRGLTLPVGDTEARWAELVEAINEDQKVARQLNSRLIEFLKDRLRESMATIEKLSADTTLNRVDDFGISLATASGRDSLSGMSQPPNTMPSTSLLPASKLLVGFEPQHNEDLDLNQGSPSHTSTKAEPVYIQVDNPHAATSNEEQNDTSLRNATSSMRKRKRTQPKDPVKFKHECNTCGERFTRSTTLREHARTHNNERPYPCSECPKAFARNKDRIRHEALHGGEKIFLCDFSWDGIPGACGRYFAREDGLVAHWRTERGWKCLQKNLGYFVTEHAKSATKSGNKFCCCLTSDACNASFSQFEDLEAHLIDPANKKCVAEWLIKSFLEQGRSSRLGAEPELSAEEPDEEEGCPDVQEVISPLPSEAIPRSVRTTYQDSLQQIEEHAESALPNVSTRNNTAENQQEMIAPSSQNELCSFKEPVLDADPFASWSTFGAYCGPPYVTSGYIIINIKCETMPSDKYSVIIETLEGKFPKTRWISVDSDVYRCWPSENTWGKPAIVNYLLLRGKAVYVLYKSDLGPEKTFPIGTLDSANGIWKIIPSSESAVPANPQAVHEIVEERSPVENALMSISGNNRSHESEAAIDEVINDRSQSNDAPVLETETQPSTLDFSNWVLLGSGFDKDKRRIWAETRCPESEVHSKSLYFVSGLSHRSVTVEPAASPVWKSFLLWTSIDDWPPFHFTVHNYDMMELGFRRPDGSFTLLPLDTGAGPCVLASTF